MANTDVVLLILETARDYFTYMMPIIGILGGIVFIFSAVFAVVFGMGRRTFRG